MSKIWFSSDYHLNHYNILRYCNRPFTSLEEMNETIIRKHNERVKPEDTIFFLGDFCFKNTPGGKEGEGLPIKAEDLIKRFNGRFVFIQGNHDCFPEETELLTKEGYKKYLDLKIGELIPTLNVEKNKVEFKPIQKIIINKTNSAYMFKSRASEGIFSDNHKLLYVSCNKKSQNEIKKDTCKNLWKRKSFFNLLSAHKSSFEEYPITDYELKLLAWILTDGGIQTSKNSKIYRGIYIWQSKIKFIKEIKFLLEKLNIKFNHRQINKKRKLQYNKYGHLIKENLVSNVFYIISDYSRKLLAKYELKSKYILPSWVYLLSDRQVNLFIDELIKGDGHIQNSGTKVLWGKKEFLKQMLGLCVTHGIDANLIQQKTRKESYYLYIRINRNQKYVTRQICKNNRKIVNYNKKMWCVNAENHNIFVQLNGRPLITGNSNNSLKTHIQKVVINYGGKRINLIHNPAFVDFNYELNFVGHVHEKWKFQRIKQYEKFTDAINVGVDVNNFMPKTFEELYSEYRKWLKSDNLITKRDKE